MGHSPLETKIIKFVESHGPVTRLQIIQHVYEADKTPDMHRGIMLRDALSYLSMKGFMSVNKEKRPFKYQAL